MASIEENLYVKNYTELTGKVELAVDFDNITIDNKNTLKTCSINKVLESNINNQNMKETEVILDKTTQSQLTPKFIKANSKSEWAHVSKQIELLYLEKDLNKFDKENVMRLVSKFVDGLEKDFENFNKGLPVSDCGLFAPRSRSTYNNPEHPIRFVNEIVNKLYVEKNRVTKFENGKVMYTKLISKLSKKYVEQYTHEFLANNKYKLFRLLEHNRNNWCVLKNKPLGTIVTEPTAMPVEVAPLEEFEPFFKFLNSNAEPVDNNWEHEACMLFMRGALYKDKRMDLCKQVVGPNWIEMLMSSLKSNTQVEHFLLGNNIVGPVGGKAIGEFLLNEHTAKIKTWYVAGNDLNSEAIKWICEGLKTDTDCLNLWLKRNPLKPEGIKYIGELLKVNKHIKILDLHNTAVLDEGVKYLVEGLKENRVLRHLYLDANGITSVGAGYLCRYFEYLIENDLEGISSLWFDMNNIGDDATIQLVTTLGKYKYLKRLNLGSSGLSEKFVPSLVSAFSNHKNLIVLDLGMYKSTSDMGLITNNIGDEGMSLLTELIKSNKSIQYLSVMMNGMTKKGIEELNQAIQSNETIMYVDFAQYGVEIPQQLYSSIKAKVESNRINSGYTRKLRNLKHGENIHWIDSIYRNNMK
jgi:Ran GTPase-activating protein (RanGAP) involved in mRNA processing and transport